MIVITVPGLPGINTPGSGLPGLPELLPGDDTTNTMRQFTQAMAALGTASGMLDTSPPLGQHNGLPAIGMLLVASGQSHP